MNGGCDGCGMYCLDCSCNLQEAIAVAWPRIQVDQRPPHSFQAMARVMEKFRVFFEAKIRYFDAQKNIKESMMAAINPGEGSICSYLVSRMADIGRAQERITNILDDEIFRNLSKHNPYWHSEHDIEADKLHDVRCKLSCMMDNLWDLWSILKKDEE